MDRPRPGEREAGYARLLQGDHRPWPPLEFWDWGLGFVDMLSLEAHLENSPSRVVAGPGERFVERCARSHPPRSFKISNASRSSGSDVSMLGSPLTAGRTLLRRLAGQVAFDLLSSDQLASVIGHPECSRHGFVGVLAPAQRARAEQR